MLMNNNEYLDLVQTIKQEIQQAHGRPESTPHEKAPVQLCRGLKNPMLPHITAECCRACAWACSPPCAPAS